MSSLRKAAQGTCTRKRRGNTQRASGGRGGEANPCGPVRAQRAAPGLPQWPLQPQPYHNFRGCHPQGAQAQVKLIVGDKCLGMPEVVGEVFPETKYQRCTVHFYRNVFSVTPRSKVKLVAKMLKAIHARESKNAAREKARAVVGELRAIKLKEAAKKVEAGIEETLTYCDFPSEHWTRIRTNKVIERLNREIRRRTRVVGSFPDGNSAFGPVCARLRHVAGTQWGNMKHLEAALEDTSIAG